MSDPTAPRPPQDGHPRLPLTDVRKDHAQDPARMPCDRCGVEMYRMHAVWRCPACGFKTDCCGW